MVTKFVRFLIVAENEQKKSLSFGAYPITPREGPGGLSRECILRIPNVIAKGD